MGHEEQVGGVSSLCTVVETARRTCPPLFSSLRCESTLIRGKNGIEECHRHVIGCAGGGVEAQGSGGGDCEVVNGREVEESWRLCVCEGVQVGGGEGRGSGKRARQGSFTEDCRRRSPQEVPSSVQRKVTINFLEVFFYIMDR